MIAILSLLVVQILQHRSITADHQQLTPDHLLERRDSSTPTKPLDYLTDSVCGGCRHAIVNETHRCGQLLQTLLDGGLSPGDALAQLSRIQACQHCQGCTNHRYWRYDRVMQTDAGSIIHLPSIDATFRLPRVARANVTAVLERYPRRRFLFEYNPSLIVLPQSQQERLRAGYLWSVRVANRNFCFRPADRQLWRRGRELVPEDYLGLALLDEHLQVIKSVVVDVQSIIPEAEDFRLFVLDDQVYLGTADVLTPLWLNESVPASVQVPNVFGTDLGVYVHSNVSCVPCQRIIPGICGKNLNYFTVDGQIYTEIWPSPPHQVRLMDLKQACNRSSTPVSIVDDQTPPLPTFSTVEEVHFPALTGHQVLLTRGRGSACCIELTDPRSGQLVLVGIEHAKTPSQRQSRLPPNVIDNHYLSRWYALEPHSSFRLVARSGLFCLGFGAPQESQSVVAASVTKWRHLELGSNFDCPRIHFVSGLTLAAGDPSTAWIAYGINDCVSRLVKIKVNEIERLLFGPVG